MGLKKELRRQWSGLGKRREDDWDYWEVWESWDNLDREKNIINMMPSFTDSSMRFGMTSKPKKSLGQNFLINQGIVQKIIAAAELKNSDNVLEVGPGKGVLTFELAERVKRLVAVEKDDLLCDGIVEMVGKLGKVGIFNEDILKFDLNELKKEFQGEPYKVVANLPYNITSKFLRIFLEADYHPTEMILMVQKEVAERICAKPGQMSVLAVSVQFFCEPKILFKVSPGSFFPAPKVESAVIKLANISGDRFKVNQEKFFEIVKAGFSARRKQLKNNLKQIFGDNTELAIKSAGLKPEQRPQELEVGDWVKLVRLL